MFVTAIHRKRPEPNKSRSLRVLCGGDGEILNLLAPLGASRAEEFSRPFLSCGLQRLQATFHLSQQKKHCCSSAFCGGDGGMPFMYTTVSSPLEGYIISQKVIHVNRFASMHSQRQASHCK